VWAVVLAGGDGTRLRSLTRLVSGEERPKQYYPLYGGETLLAQTRARLARAIHPERTAFAVLKAHEKFYGRELADVEPRRLVVQPANKGTTAAVIRSLMRITNLAGDPVVAFFPTDHYFSNEARFIDSVRRAVSVAQHHSDTLVVLGAEAEYAEVEYGWIEPSARFESPVTNTLLRVSRFWEKPSHATAQALLARGCLWNTFVMAGRASIFLAMLDKTVAPGVVQSCMRAQRDAGGGVPNMAAEEELWERLTAGDFSRQVLSANPEDLAVLRVGDVGWSDLGTPERVRSTMQRYGLGPQWQESAEDETSKEPAQNGVRRRFVSGPIGGARRTLCAVKELARTSAI